MSFTSFSFAASLLRNLLPGLPSFCDNSNLYSSFSNNSEVTAVTHTKRINRNLFAQGN